MRNGRMTNMNRRPQRPADHLRTAQAVGIECTHAEQNGAHNAKRNYERYLALAQAEIQAGDRIAAENYYQHAEHYFRSMSSNQE